VETKWHGAVSDLIIMLNCISIATDVGRWQLDGMVLHWGISFEITKGISVPRLL
jgi:hypothetical protein